MDTFAEQMLRNYVENQGDKFRDLASDLRALFKNYDENLDLDEVTAILDKHEGEASYHVQRCREIASYRDED